MSFRDQGRILYVSMADVSLPNGPGVNEREFLLSLYKHLGNRVHAVIPRPRRACTEIDARRTTLYRNPSRWNLIGFLLQQIELYHLVRRLTKAEHFDLIVTRLSLIPLAMFFALRRTRTPYAIKTLGEVQGFTMNPGVKGLIGKLLGPLNGCLFRRLVPRALAVDCCTKTHYSEHLKDYHLSAEQLIVVENATNVARFQAEDASVARKTLGLSQFAPVLGFVGGTPAERGGRQMLDVASRLIAEFPRLGVVIVGNDDRGLLKHYAAELGLQNKVVVPGLVPYEDIHKYINSFDVCFALDRPQRFSLIGNSYQKVRQYLACEKPVLTCIDPDSELAKNGYVVNIHPDDTERMVDAVRAVLNERSDASSQRRRQASEHVRSRLSTDYTLSQRLSFWERRLGHASRKCA